jgi:adenylate cyclase
MGALLLDPLQLYAELPQVDSPDSETKVQTLRVLLIDDQPIIGEAIHRLLRDEENLEFHYCSNPAEAIPMALRIRPTVILQDLVMPEIDGLMLLRFFRAHPQTSNIPMVVLSSKDEPELKARAFSLGANDYLVKVPAQVELIARIRYHSHAYRALIERNEAFEAMEFEKKRSDMLLLNILPKDIARQLKDGSNGKGYIASSYASVSVLFADIVGFTKLSATVSAEDLVKLLNGIFSGFDQLSEKHGLEKIKTIGDAYMVVAGIPIERADHAQAIARMALDMQLMISEFKQNSTAEEISVRIGIASGPVVAGIIGIKKFIYDLWGDTVNTASRMESHGEPNRIHISDVTRQLLGDDFACEERGFIQVKGKGEMKTYFLGAGQPSADRTEGE